MVPCQVALSGVCPCANPSRLSLFFMESQDGQRPGRLGFGLTTEERGAQELGWLAEPEWDTGSPPLKLRLPRETMCLPPEASGGAPCIPLVLHSQHGRMAARRELQAPRWVSWGRGLVGAGGGV